MFDSRLFDITTQVYERKINLNKTSKNYVSYEYFLVSITLRNV